jgi:hypothetical protein
MAYYSKDIRNALLAAEQASRGALLAAGDDKEFAQGYREGYRAALTTIALAPLRWPRHALTAERR